VLRHAAKLKRLHQAGSHRRELEHRLLYATLKVTPRKEWITPLIERTRHCSRVSPLGLPSIRADRSSHPRRPSAVGSRTAATGHLAQLLIRRRAPFAPLIRLSSCGPHDSCMPPAPSADGDAQGLRQSCPEPSKIGAEKTLRIRENSANEGWLGVCFSTAEPLLASNGKKHAPPAHGGAGASWRVRPRSRGAAAPCKSRAARRCSSHMPSA
jgi:hypothetical protein